MAPNTSENAKRENSRITQTWGGLMHYYKFNIGDWIRRTAHLSALEEGVYFRLINHYYDTEQSFPEDMVSVIRQTRLTDQEDAVQTILQEFFHLSKGFWFHSRCEDEIAAYKFRLGIARDNGAKGGRPRKPKPNGNQTKTRRKPVGNPTGTKPKPEGNPEEN